MKQKSDNNDIKLVTNIPKELSTKDRGGHKVRTGREIVDRSKLEQIIVKGSGEKQPNTYTGHTYKNIGEKFRLDGHKLIYHIERILKWQKGERVAPVTIDMGLTKFCNTACIYCIGVTQGGFTKGQMIEPDALMRFIEDCGRLDVKGIAFIGDGEPTLNPAMYDAVVLAKKIGIDIGIGTNGLKIDMNRAEDILRDATYVRINLSAGSREGFAKIHQSSPDNFDMLLEKIKTMVKIRKKNDYKCTIGIQMVLIPENFNEIMKLAKLGANLGVDYLQIKQCSDTEYHELGISPKDYERVQDVLKEAEKQSTGNYLVKVKWNKINIMDETEVYRGGFRKYDICYGTPLLGQISGNGKVYPCGPFFEKKRFLVGDINRDSYYDIVKSDRYWNVQQDIVNNVDVHCDCTIGCRQDYINKFLWDLKNPPEHINFI